MALYSALKKLSQRKKEQSYYNSNYILTPKEKQSLIIGGFLTIFPLIITSLVLLIN